MARIALVAALCLALPVHALPARADVAQAVDEVIAPAYDRLAAAATALDTAAQADCAAQALRAPYQALWDGWAAIDFLHLGPAETSGRALALHFWPDAKSSGLRAQQGLVASDAAVIDDPAGFAKISVAARGLGGMERLLYPSDLTGDEDVLCRLRRATAADLARTAGMLRAEWGGFAHLLTHPGTKGNTDFLTEDEARAALFTQLMTGLEYLADTRLGRPLGSFDKPRPERAEAIAAGRSLRNVTLSLTGLRALALALYPDAPASAAAFDRAIAQAEGLDDPVFAGAADPQARLKIEILQQSIRAARDAVETEIGGGLGVSVGFNAKDGD